MEKELSTYPCCLFKPSKPKTIPHIIEYSDSKFFIEYRKKRNDEIEKEAGNHFKL